MKPPLNKEEMEKSIPKGLYCYDENGTCPWHEIRPELPEQENGYCYYLRKSDYDMNREVVPYTNTRYEDGVPIVTHHKTGPDNPGFFSILWDFCKECGINKDEENNV